MRDEICNRCKEGRLVLLKPSLPDIPLTRSLFVSKAVQAFLEGPWPDESSERRSGRLRADLETFIAGGKISVSWVPYKAKNAYFGRLDPLVDEVWEIRSRDPRPGIRVLGSFAETDVFVALEWRYREQLGGPKLGAEDPRWRDAIVNTKTQWRNLFISYRPHMGASLERYISENAFLI